MTDRFSPPLRLVDRVCVLSRGRKLVYFAGCDYLRLSSQRRVLRAIEEGLKRFGLSTAASRKTTGNHEIYGALEKAVAGFFGAEAAVLASSGYLANVAAGQALRGVVDRVLIDERCHWSLREAVASLNAPVAPFQHRDPEDLRRKAGPGRRSRLLVVTDGVFAHDGSVAPLKRYREACGGEALLWVDDAHGVGVLGVSGGGLVESAGLSRARLIETVTFSKAFGVYGGAVVCDKSVRQRLIANSAVVSGNTPMPLPLACGVLAALNEIKSNPVLRQRLENNIGLFWNVFGLAQPEVLIPIVALRPEKPAAVARALRAAGVFPSLIQYPGGTTGSYFRFAISSAHTREQVTRLAKLLRQHREQLEVLGR